MTNYAASLTLLRDHPTGRQVFWARRRHDRTFLGGFHAFFAGSVEADDQEHPVDSPGLSDREFRVAALRECHEECRLFVGPDGAIMAPDDPPPEAPLAIDRLHCFGWWTTASQFNNPFLTAFYGLLLRDHEARATADHIGAHLDDAEFIDGTWIHPADALSQWRQGRAFITTPIRRILQELAKANTEMSTPTATSPSAQGAALTAIQPLGPRRQAPHSSPHFRLFDDTTLLALKTPTLPPATHTNCLVVGDKRFVVVDPGPAAADDLKPLSDLIDARIQQGHRCQGVFVTHHHGDHIGGLQTIADGLDAPILAHPKTLSRLPTHHRPTKHFVDGQRLPIDSPQDWTALHTPGHAPGHLALWNKQRRFLFAADLVASQGTIIVDPPDGNMGEYLASLRRARSLEPFALLPSHGALITAPDRLLSAYLNHRQQREQKIFDALRAHGPARPEELVPIAYEDAPKTVWPLAQRSLLAHLQHLVTRGLATEEDNRFIAL